ncbi:MAG TPA: BspA family leucine-rich repeat surface protein, partial [Dyadobacter sp.]|nr:BspA family leucine-rich repeat surface protein [Dyadobacter sp.]
TTFNQPLNNWRFSSTEPVALSGLFFNAISFNQPLNEWNTSMVYQMGGMFRAGSGRHAFNQDLSSWELGGIDPTDGNSFGYIFSNASMDCVNFSNTLVSWASKANTPNGLFLGTTNGNEYGPAGQTALDYLVNTKGWNNLGGAIYNASCATLPVELISFDANESEREVMLTWSTSSEINSDHFEVQRSTNGRDWKHLDHVAGAGESEKVRLYKFTDATPLQGVNYYRLKMVDIDQTFAYSRIVSVNRKGGESIYVYPNPTTDLIKLNRARQSSISKVDLVDMNGKVVYTSEKIPVDGIRVRGLVAKGIYILALSYADGSNSSDRIVVTD